MIKRIAIILLSTSLLSACLPTAFVACATAGGMVTGDRRSISTMMVDKKINCQALIQLNSEPRLKKTSHITTTTFNRVILLVGETRTEALRHRAYELVKAVPDIRRINNAVIIADPLDSKERTMDTWTTTKVKSIMLAEKGLNSTQIKVVTEDSVVYLLGLVTHPQAELATDVARQVSGVRKVVTLFEYIN